MYCTKCGIELDERAGYCSQCGTATGRVTSTSLMRTLTRSRTDRKIAGVCGGMAKYLDWDSTFVRVLWLLLLFALPPAGLIGYIAAWIVMPLEAYVVPATTTQTSTVHST